MSRSYTSAKREHLGVKPDFELDGVKFTCEGELTTLDLSELAEVAELGVDTEDPRAAAAISKFFRAALGERVYRQFKEHMRSHGTDDDNLIDIMAGIMEDYAARPTEQPSSSHDGQSTTGPTSNPGSRVVSLQAGTVDFRPAPTPGAEAAVLAAGSSSYQPARSSTPYTRFA